MKKSKDIRIKRIEIEILITNFRLPHKSWKIKMNVNEKFLITFEVISCFFMGSFKLMYNKFLLSLHDLSEMKSTFRINRMFDW